MRSKIKNFLSICLSLVCIFTSVMGGGVITAMANTTEVSVYDIKINDLVAPIGIDTKIPSFSWKMASDNTGAKQTAYQVIVTGENETEVWNTGWVESDKSQGITYEGCALQSSTKYTVSVAIKDEKGAATATSVTTFETALLEADAFSDTK